MPKNTVYEHNSLKKIRIKILKSHHFLITFNAQFKQHNKKVLKNLTNIIKKHIILITIYIITHNKMPGWKKRELESSWPAAEKLTKKTSSENYHLWEFSGMSCWRRSSCLPAFPESLLPWYQMPSIPSLMFLPRWSLI